MLITKKVIIFVGCANFIDLFMKKLVELLSEQIKINIYAINLIEGKYLSYRPIYNLGLIKPKTLKIFKDQPGQLFYPTF